MPPTMGMTCPDLPSNKKEAALGVWRRLRGPPPHQYSVLTRALWVAISRQRLRLQDVHLGMRCLWPSYAAPLAASLTPPTSGLTSRPSSTPHYRPH